MRALFSKQRWQIAWLGLWFIAIAVPLAYLGGFHTLPFQARTPAGKFSVTRAAGEWAAIHVLGVDCACSKRVMSILLDRGPVKGLAQKVVLVGQDEKLAADLRARGYVVESSSDREALAKFGATATPLVVFLRPDDSPAYSGGYSDERFVPKGTSKDLEIFESIKAGRTPAAYPIFGCANGDEMRKAQDPLRLKYK